jgi:hypothetical protein
MPPWRRAGETALVDRPLVCAADVSRGVRAGRHRFGAGRLSCTAACKLIASFGQAELKMIKYVEANTAKCGIPPQIAEQLKGGHKNTDAIQKKVCDVAQQQGREPVGPVGDFDYPLNR